MRNDRGQINLEFLAAAGFFLLAIGAVLTASSEILPQFSQETDRASLNLEARSLTSNMLSEPGNHSYGPGTDWEKNSNTVDSINSFGLANDFLELDRNKIESLSTVSTQPDQLDYSTFKNVTDASNQYRFRFEWFPTVETHRSFIRGSSPSFIIEPDDSAYQKSDNRVHYGNITLEGEDYYFLVIAYDGVYNTTYLSDDWNFYGNSQRGRYEQLTDAPFTVKSFQNRERDPGSLIVLNQTIKTFGANIDSDSIVTTFNRFAMLENEPIRIKVWTW